MGLLVDRLAARLEPGLVGVPVGHPGQEMLAPVPFPRMGPAEELGFGADAFEEVEGEGILALGDPGREPQGHGAYLVVDDELLQALRRLEIEHPGSGDDVDPGQRGQDRPHPRLGAGLGIDELGVAETM